MEMNAGMKKRFLTGLTLALILVLSLAGTALAADTFRFEEKSIRIFEGDTALPALERSGAAAGEGELSFSVSKPSVLAVGEDGTITGLKKGESVLKATLKIGKKTWTASASVKVLRAVTKVTLNTTKLLTFRPTDVQISGLLEEEPEGNVILLTAGKNISLGASVTPADASDPKVTFASSDDGVLRVRGKTAKAVQAGECLLSVTSDLNPEVQEFWHVLVVQPVTRLTLSAPEGKTVPNGGSIPLAVSVSPANATIQSVEWSSRNPDIASVDAAGQVTGVTKGSTTIIAKATDGSGVSGSIQVTVAQRPTGISVRETNLMLATRQQAYLHPTVEPANANERGVIFTSTNPAVATVTPAGQVKGIKRGECEIVITAKGNPAVSASVPVQVIQKVEKIVFGGTPVSLPVRTTTQLMWDVLPEDATIKDVTFSSANRNVATVNQDGLVTGIARGTANITASATDGSGRKGTVRVTVTQPVEGVSMQYGVYHVQLEGGMNAKAIVSPSNANNLNVHFTTDDGSIATVTDKRNIGYIRGWSTGTTMLNATTEDGGFTATAQIRVADFNRAVVVDDVYIENERIRLSFRNRSNFPVERVYFTVETWDAAGDPLVCNSDGISASFSGAYRLELLPDERTEHYRFDFDDYVQPLEKIGSVRVTITSWQDQEGYTRKIPEDARPSQVFRRFLPTPTPSPTPKPTPTPSPTPTPEP